MNFMNIRHAFKSIPIQLDTIHSECYHTMLNTFKWKGERILVNYTFDGPDICLFPSAKYSLRIFITTTRSYVGGNVNLFFLTGPLEPWQKLSYHKG